jgi:hypothetical protein
MEEVSKFIKLREAERYTKNPFLKDDVLSLDTGKKMIIAGSTKNVIVNTDTGETEGVVMMHKYREVDREQFVKIFVKEVDALFDLSKAGLKVFGYVLNAMRVNTDEIYLSISKLMEYCGYRQKNQVYKGLSELMANKIIAMSKDQNIWFVNPTVVFNGDRVAFVKEYRVKDYKKVSQVKLFSDAKKAISNSEN